MAEKEKKHASSMKTAFIRISSKNETNKDGLVSYDRGFIGKTMDEWSKSAKMEYWWIEHSADEDVSITHWHIVIRFGSPTPFENVKSRFPYGDIETCKHGVKSCVQYLIHMNDPSKKPYEWSDVVTNCTDMSPYKVLTNAQGEVTLQTIMDKIDSGEIREYNQFQKIPIDIWAKYKTRIKNGLEFYKERICMDKDREIQVVFISGQTGCGKTTFAKKYCERKMLSYCITSSSNDPMQDYKGEDVLIMDDLRDSDFKFTDLLKILDNHTRSTMQSRYNNKAFIGECIIITSYKPLNDWYFEIQRESKEQLYRRIQTQIQMTHEKIVSFSYDEKLHHYVEDYAIDNVLKMSAKKQANLGLSMLEVLGADIQDVREKLDKCSEEEVSKMISNEQLSMDFAILDNNDSLPFD